MKSYARQSLSAASEDVKNGQRSRESRGLSRHFEGWQLAIVTVGIVLGVALFVVPRATEPDVLPEPRVNWNDAERLADSDRQRVHSAEQNPLPYEVRGVGEAFRNFGAVSITKIPSE